MDESVREGLMLFMDSFSQDPELATKSCREMNCRGTIMRELMMLLLAEGELFDRIRPAVYATICRLLRVHSEALAKPGSIYEGMTPELVMDFCVRLVFGRKEDHQIGNVTDMVCELAMKCQEVRVPLFKQLEDALVNGPIEEAPTYVRIMSKLWSLLLDDEVAALEEVLGLLEKYFVEMSPATMAVQMAIFRYWNVWQLGATAVMKSEVIVKLLSIASERMAWAKMKLNPGNASEMCILLDYAEAAAYFAEFAGVFINDVEQPLQDRYRGILANIVHWCCENLVSVFELWSLRGGRTFPYSCLLILSQCDEYGLESLVASHSENLLLMAVLYGRLTAEDREAFELSAVDFWWSAYPEGVGIQTVRQSCHDILTLLLVNDAVSVCNGILGAFQTPLRDTHAEVLIYYLSRTITYVIQSGNEQALESLRAAALGIADPSTLDRETDSIIRVARFLFAASAVSILPDQFVDGLFELATTVVNVINEKSAHHVEWTAPEITTATAMAELYFAIVAHRKCTSIPDEAVMAMIHFSDTCVSDAAVNILSTITVQLEHIGGQLIDVVYWPQLCALVNQAECDEDITERKKSERQLSKYATAIVAAVGHAKGNFNRDTIHTCIRMMMEQDMITYALLLMEQLGLVLDAAEFNQFLAEFIVETWPMSSVWGYDLAKLVVELIGCQILSLERRQQLVDRFIDMIDQDDIEPVDLTASASALCRIALISIGQDDFFPVEQLAGTESVMHDMFSSLGPVNLSTRQALPAQLALSLGVLEIELTKVVCGRPQICERDLFMNHLNLALSFQTFVTDYHRWLLAVAMSRTVNEPVPVNPQEIIQAAVTDQLGDYTLLGNSEFEQDISCGMVPPPERMFVFRDAWVPSKGLED